MLSVSTFGIPASLLSRYANTAFIKEKVELELQYSMFMLGTERN